MQIQQQTQNQLQQPQTLTFKKALEEYDSKYKTLVDYFCIVGASDEELQNAIEQAKNNQSTIIHPQILSRAPEIDKPSIAFPNQVTEFCFPNKFCTISSKELREQSQTSSSYVVLTSADGNSIYVVAFTFYEDLGIIEESLANHKQLFANLSKNQSPDKNQEELSDKDRIKNIGNVKFDLSKSSKKTKTQQKGSKMQEEESKTAQAYQDFVMADRNKMQRQSSFNKELMNGSNQFYDDDSSEEDLNMEQSRHASGSGNLDEEEKKEDNIQEKLPRGRFFIQKAMCILSRQPFFEHFRLVLIDVKRACEGNLKAPLEDYITQMLYSIPAPPRGITKVNLKLICKNHPFRNLLFMYPPINKLPHTNNDFIITLFDCLNVDNVLLFFKRILLDSNNLMVSKDQSKLVQIGEAIKSLIFPFKYEFIYVPYLPESLVDYLNAPVPFLMGIDQSMQREAEDNISDGTYIIDLDQDKITSKQKTSVTLSSTGRFKAQQKDDLPELPDSQSKKLQKTIKDIIKPKKKKQQRLSNEDVDNIREAFFMFFVNVFQSYEKYIPQGSTSMISSIQKTVEGVSGCFNYQKYIEDSPSDCKMFFKYFLRLQMFTRLLERKLWPSKNEDIIDVTFFDEHIRSKFNKVKKSSRSTQQETFFLNDQSRNHQSFYECDVLARVEKQFDDQLAQTIFKNQNQYPVQYESEQNILYYRVLPQKLNSEYMNKLFMEDCYKNEELKTYNDMLNSRQHNVSDVSNRKQRVQQYFDELDKDINVHICWLLIWVGTLRYQNQNEQSFRLKQAIEVLRKINAKSGGKLNLEIFELLMDTCDKYGTLKMVLEIYDQIEEFKFKPNAAIMTYLCSGLSKNNQSMEQVQKMFKKHKAKHEIDLNPSTGIQNKLTSEIERRFNSAKRFVGKIASGITGSANQTSSQTPNVPKTQQQQSRDWAKPVIEVNISDLAMKNNNNNSISARANNISMTMGDQSLISERSHMVGAPKPFDSNESFSTRQAIMKNQNANILSQQPSNRNNYQNQNGQIGSLLDTRSYLYKTLSSKFKRRCFLNKDEQEMFISDKVRMLLKEVCGNCGATLYPKDILKHTVKESENFYKFQCMACYSHIYPQLTVRIGDMNIFKNEDTTFINPIQLRQYVEDRLQLDNWYRNAEQITPEILRYHHKNIYWNLIWYFAEFHLPYDFIVPYADDSLYEEFVKTNRHLIVRNKLRLDQLVVREGGIDNYIKYVEEMLKREKQHKRTSNTSSNKQGSSNQLRASRGKKKVVTQTSNLQGGEILRTDAQKYNLVNQQMQQDSKLKQDTTTSRQTNKEMIRSKSSDIAASRSEYKIE